MIQQQPRFHNHLQEQHKLGGPSQSAPITPPTPPTPPAAPVAPSTTADETQQAEEQRRLNDATSQQGTNLTNGNVDTSAGVKKAVLGG